MTNLVPTPLSLRRAGRREPWERGWKNDMYDLPVQDCTQEQNGSHYFFSQRSTMQMAIFVRKDCWDPENLLPW